MSAPASSPSCLIVVDVQQQFINEHTRHVVPGIQAQLDRFDWVFASRLLPQTGGPIHRWKGFLPKPAGDPGSQLAINLAGRDPARTRLIEKTGFGALSPAAREEMQQLGIHTAHVCGFDTDLCVLRTLHDLLDLGVRPMVYTDLLATTAGEPLHSGALLIIKRLVGKAQLVTARSAAPTADRHRT